jgi:Holliday junction DNA helicase RuvA
MIGYLKGVVQDFDGKKAIVIVNDTIGYELNYSKHLQVGSEVELYVHHHISDNDQSLWGFEKVIDKKMFELLKTVNKVGSSKAFPLVMNIGVEGIIDAIRFEKTNVLTEAPGIGKKMAEQIILSLKDKVQKFQEAQNLSFNLSGTTEISASSVNVEYESMNDVLLALDSLGYKDKQVGTLVRKQFESGLSSTEDIIKNVLREL